MIWWIIAIVVYLIVAYATYEFKVQEWKQPKWEKIVISLSWPCLVILYGIKSLLKSGQ